MEPNLGSIDGKMNVLLRMEWKKKGRERMRLRRTDGGRSDLCVTVECTEVGNEDMRNDQNGRDVK